MLNILRAWVTADGLTWAVTVSFWLFLAGSLGVWAYRRKRGIQPAGAAVDAAPQLSVGKRRAAFFGILLLAAVLRLAFLTEWPRGIAFDEASIGYEAMSILSAGMDRHGNSWPVYFISWGGSGHSAAYVYLAALSYRLFGVSDFALRLPQALCALGAIAALYFLGKKLGGARAGLWVMLLCALCPWHIMMSRWALDCYLFSSFFAVAFTLLLYARDDARFWIPACAVLGLSLYTYALSYVFLAVFLPLYGIVLWRTRRKESGGVKAGRLLCGLGVLAVLALPLVLFTLITLGVLPQFALGPVTLPAFTLSRAGEIGRDIPGNLLILLRLLFLQQETANNAFNIIPALGVTFLFLAPFWLVGLGAALRALWRALRYGEPGPQAALAAWFFAGFVQCALVSCYNSWTANGLLLCMIVLAAEGVRVCCGAALFAPGGLPYLRPALALWLCAGAGCFVMQYCFATANVSAIKHFDTMDTAIARCEALRADGRSVYVSEGAGGGNAYVYLCYYTQLPVRQFLSEARYGTPIDAWETVTDLGAWHFCTDGEDAAQRAGENAVFLLDVYQDNLPHFEQSGYTVENYGVTAVAYLEDGAQ